MKVSASLQVAIVADRLILGVWEILGWLCRDIPAWEDHRSKQVLIHYPSPACFLWEHS